MEEAAKSIECLAKQILPKQPYYLSLSPTRKYQIQPDNKRLDEQDTRPLQYTTLVGGEADRGVLLTRAYFTVREEPNSAGNAPTPTTLKVDPNKPRKKVSLKDYRNKKVEGDSPPKLEIKEKANGLSTIKEKEETEKRKEPTSNEMAGYREVKRPAANVKVEARQYSHSPERKKRAGETDEGPKPFKRVKVEDAASNGVPSRSFKDTASQKPVRSIAPGKTEAKDMKPPSVTNGRTITSSSALRASSPKTISLVNGHGKVSGQATHKRAISNGEPVSKAVPRLLSPLFIGDLSVEKPADTVKENASETRPGLKKRPADTSNFKLQPKKSRNDREPSPSTKKRKVLPPLLSPTLPPIVMDELSRMEKKQDTPSKEVGLKNSQGSDSSVVVKKPPKSTREDTIHVDNKREPTQYIVTLKYKKRQTKTIERLLNLPPGGKKKIEGLKRDDQVPRESSGSVEPGTARKRPRIAADVSEAQKRPRSSDTLRPSTPPKQSTSISRIASHGSQVDTPGATHSLTPSTHPHPERLREADRQKAQRLHASHRQYMDVGKKLKYQRDGFIKGKGIETITDREFRLAAAAGIQSLVIYLYAVKFKSDACELERAPPHLQPWREIVALFPMYTKDCGKNIPLLALICRIQGVFMNHMSRVLWNAASEPDTSEKLIRMGREEQDYWRRADQHRQRLGIYDGSSGASDGGVVGKLIDRLGPWTSPEDIIRITLEVLRHVLHIDGPWKPIDELAKFGRIANGATGS
ncbi:hypothetical protein F5Y09DRAFT_271500 [Xylaria sp. FL1042]|nr:hypothetical protein F5Y09DRAFT_271500 [Xylaria sp. FL1042]